MYEKGFVKGFSFLEMLLSGSFSKETKLYLFLVKLKVMILDLINGYFISR